VYLFEKNTYIRYKTAIFNDSLVESEEYGAILSFTDRTRE
jgi:hypothetical protein